MAVGELFIGAFITVLFEKLASGDLIRLARSAGIYSELNKWTDTLTQIQAVLADAGQKHIHNKPVQLWLNKLQHLAYEIDDVLDDMATETMRQQLKRQSDASSSRSSTRKVLKFIPNKLHALKYGHKMSSKLDGITTKLRHLVEEKNLLGLNDNVKSSEMVSRRLKETSLVDESEIIGREGDKEALLGRLLSSQSSSSVTTNVNVVSIVGLGGIGKTTLARVLYNDEKVKDHFELKAWVCVSDEFDVLNITKVICQAVGGGNQDSTDLNLLQESLKEKLSNKRFLLVLDDVWNERYSDWELLQRPFTKGAPGSKILATTRKKNVASVMGSVQTYQLELLSDEEALSLFAQHASSTQNVDVNRKLKLYGEDIIRKCGRLPLALRTLGRVFGEKSNDEEWEELLSSEIWTLDNGSEILPALYLSYYDLSPHLKQMFAYCSLFPKDYLFDKDKLVLLWMAEGFLSGSNTTNKSMESFGRECFEELMSRSFFQHSTNEKSRYTMHDLINDLATTVAGEFFFVLNDKNEASEKVHHISVISRDYETYERFKALQTATHVRTFLHMSLRQFSYFNVSGNSFTELPPQLQFLRVLSLVGCSITEVPKSIGRLKHMRYLNFSNTEITCLPKQVGELHNLQSLLLSSCRQLSSLPNNIGKLINLRHLDITHTPKLTKMPLGLGGLTALQTLPRVVIGGAGEYRISDLKALLHLRGRLSIEGLDKVKDAMHAKEADLQQKKGIYDLKMEWSHVFDDSRNENAEYEVLEMLRPSEKLESLEIVYYGGPKLPSWVGDPLFGCLTLLKLTRCRSCTCLPTLGRLPSLQELFVESMDGLKTLGLELLGSSNSLHGVAFPSLKVLEFNDMKSWEEWSTSRGDIAGAFPCLHQMSITNCPKLESCNYPNSIEELEIKDCASLVSLGEKEEHLKMGKQSVTKVIIQDCPRLKRCRCPNKIERLVIRGCESLVSLDMESATEVTISSCNRLESYSCAKRIETLEIRHCESLVSLDMESATKVRIMYCLRLERYWCPNHIEKFEIRECESLVSLDLESATKVRIMYCPRLERYRCANSIEKFEIIECESLVSLDMESVTEVTICGCPRLQSYICVNRIEKLEILDCPSLTSLTLPSKDNLPSTLKSLRITSCDNVEETWLTNNFLSSLESLCIYKIQNVRLFPEGCLVHLTRLTIDGCDNIESIPDDGYGFLPCLRLRYLSIGNCKNLKSIPHEHLQNLTSLEEMRICDCQSLDFPFPCGSWPPNLTFLEIGMLQKPVSEWGLQNFPTSLVTLELFGDNSDGLVSFTAKGEEEDISSSFILPSSLTSLDILGFEELELVSEGLQHLTCLQRLHIRNCPKVTDLPETLLPSLSSLRLAWVSPGLRKKCRRKGKYWPIISQIPSLDLDWT